ncbi:hypothetical protein KUCAC02_037741, partial [Chaenocephalus aceratus]
KDRLLQTLQTTEEESSPSTGGSAGRSLVCEGGQMHVGLKGLTGLAAFTCRACLS